MTEMQYRLEVAFDADAASAAGARSSDRAGSMLPSSQASGGPGGWRPVSKRRRISRFSLASGPIAARTPGLGREPGCEVELTEIGIRGEDWWTLGFEATGPASLLRGELEAAAALVFAQALPGVVQPGTDDSRSYAEWLGQRLPRSGTPGDRPARPRSAP
jgi:hypothetical protein